VPHVTAGVVQDLRGSAAENYERYFVPVIPVPLAADLMQTAALRTGEHVVDVACGTGVVARMAAQRVGPTGRVVGVDPNPGMLQVASSLPPPAGAATIEWRQGGAEALPLPDESFDFVLCQLGLMFVGDRAAALREIYRVLSQGGRVAMNVPGPMPRLFEIFDDALARHIGTGVSRFVRVVFSLSDADELKGLLRDAGFREISVDITRKTLRLPPPKSFLWQYVHSTPLGAVIANVDEAARDKLQADIEDRWQPFVAEGALVLQLPVLVATGQR
jgi:ubiquinone/menaquinone biosynthesis C-methylase UbiE